jgi:hypothetical protein
MCVFSGKHWWNPSGIEIHKAIFISGKHHCFPESNVLNAGKRFSTSANSFLFLENKLVF